MNINQNELNKIIGINIKKYRLQYYKKKKIKMTQRKLAKLINVSTSLISNIENIKYNKGIGLNNLYKISIVLEIPINKFFEVNND